MLGVVGGWDGSFWGVEVGVFSPGWAVNEELFQARGNGAAGAVFSIPSTSFLCASLAFVVVFWFVCLFWFWFVFFLVGFLPGEGSSRCQR